MLFRFLAQKMADKIFYGTVFKRVPLKEVEYYNRLSREYEATFYDWKDGTITDEEIFWRLSAIAKVIGA